MRPTVLEVNIENFKYNIEQIQKMVGSNVKLMPVIKANGYGTYINKSKEVLNMFDIVAVALVEEGVDLRKNGYQGEIMVLNQSYKDELETAISNNITLGLSCLEFLDEIKNNGKKVKVHLEIETGMGRTGINIKDLDYFIEKVKSIPNIEVEGVYSHLSSADNDEEYTKSQLETFKIATNKLKEKFDTIKYTHICASNGILNCNEDYYNLVRPGIIIYGYPSYEKTFEKLDLKPICKFKSKITFLKEVEEGTSIGYSRKFITNSKTKIATVTIGYADGLNRMLSNNGYVIINGKRAPIIGNICMDSFMVDVTEIENVKLGDDVYIWDNENITLEEVAERCHTINYEIMSTISDRVPRVFI